MKPWLAAAALLALVVLAYLPALHAGYIWDDDSYVTDNPLLTAPDGLRRIWFSAHTQSQYFPLVYTTFRLERELWGLNPFGFHLFNVCLHALNALLVWRLLRLLTVPGAWLAAAIFAVHPVQVESVAWVTELKNLESLFFYLLAVLAWLKFTDQAAVHRWWFYAMALVACLLALFAKTTACTLPAALLLVSWLRKEPFTWRRGALVLPFAAAGLAMGLLSMWWERHLGNYGAEVVSSLNLLQRSLLAGHAVWFYAGKLLLPVGLCFSYPKWTIDPRSPLQYAGLAAALAAAVLLWRKRKTWPPGALAGPIFFVAALSPMIGFIPNYTWLFSFVADHYQYPATIGLIACFTGLACSSKVVKSWAPAARAACAAMLLLVLGGLTWRQAAIYHDAGTLWRDTLEKNPASWLAQNNLGGLLASEGQYADALPLLREAVSLNPRYADALNNLGLTQAHLGNLDDAALQYRAALQLDPGLFGTWMNLGNVLERGGKVADALECFSRAAALNPTQAEPLRREANDLLALKRFAEAAAVCRQALQLAPDDDALRYDLGVALKAQGDRPAPAN